VRFQVQLQSGRVPCNLNIVPELPDIAAYIAALESRLLGVKLDRVRLGSPFLLRSVDPPLSIVEGRTIEQLRRIGKRIAFGVEGDLWLVLHLMIAGRLHWKKRDVKLGGRQNLAAFDFPDGSLLLTEAGSKHRASLHVVRGVENLATFDAGGIDIFDADLNQFRSVLSAESAMLTRTKFFTRRSSHLWPLPRSSKTKSGRNYFLPLG
jgi:formamidopyrimidine-DNA glycosylase